MGGRSSKEDGSFRQNSSSSSSSWSGYPHVQPPYAAPQQSYPPPQYSYPPQNYGQESQGYAPQQQSYPSSQYSSPPPPDYGGKRKLDRRYSRIADSYNSLEEVNDVLYLCNVLIFG